jgi:hypothetical protein
MKRIILMLTVAAFMVAALTVTAAAAFAVSPSERECEDRGGVFTREQGEVNCRTVETEQGKNERQPKFQQQTITDTSGQGNINNKQEEEETTTCNTPCPPGQFKD